MKHWRLAQLAIACTRIAARCAELATAELLRASRAIALGNFFRIIARDVI
jgi:hypothetical protein